MATPKVNVLLGGVRLLKCTDYSDNIKYDNTTDDTFDGIEKTQAETPDIEVSCSDIKQKNAQYNQMIDDAIATAGSTDEGLAISIEDTRVGITKHYTGCVVDSISTKGDPKKKPTGDFKFSATGYAVEYS